MRFKILIAAAVVYSGLCPAIAADDLPDQARQSGVAHPESPPVEIPASIARPSALNNPDGGGEWRSLLDEELSDWEIWMGVPHVSVSGLPEGTPRSTNGRTGTPM